MLRRVLTYQLILAVAVGQFFCCCATANVTVRTSAKTKTLSHESTRGQSEIVSHSCCSHKHAKLSSEQKPASEKPDSDQKPVEKCPCKDGAGKTPITQPETTQSATSALLQTLTLEAIAPFDLPATETDACGCDESSLSHYFCAHLTAAELLYAHHNLRC